MIALANVLHGESIGLQFPDWGNKQDSSMDYFQETVATKGNKKKEYQ